MLHLLVTKKAMELDDELVFFFGEVAAFEVGTEVVDPAKPATLPASEKACGFRK